MTLKDRTEDVMKMLDEETTRSNKELLIAAAVCTMYTCRNYNRIFCR